jgi:hypothetical protein
VGVPSYVRDPPSCAPLCTKETRERIQGKRKKKKEMMRNDEGAACCCRKEKKEKQKKKRNKREREFVGEKERKIEFFSQPLPSEIGGSFVVRS